MANEANVVRRGVYNVEYFSGAQVSLYIGDIWVDEITTLSYGYIQNRQPIYGYASTLYDDLSEGQILVQGNFTVNFKEAGYLWLILDRYKGLATGHDLKSGKYRTKGPFENSHYVNRNAIERLVNNELSVFERHKVLQELVEQEKNYDPAKSDDKAASQLARKRLAERSAKARQAARTGTSASLRGFSSDIRAGGGIGTAENIFEDFEDAVWGSQRNERVTLHRRTDDPALNPFDIYVAFGDFAGDGHANHTIERINTVSILGKSKQIVIDGMPIQEQYTFIGRELI